MFFVFNSFWIKILSRKKYYYYIYYNNLYIFFFSLYILNFKLKNIYIYWGEKKNIIYLSLINLLFDKYIYCFIIYYFEKQKNIYN